MLRSLAPKTGSACRRRGFIAPTGGKLVRPPLPPPPRSERLLARVAPSQVGMFRFLLEACDNVAYFTVLDRRAALLKIVFSPHQEHAARAALAHIATSLPLDIREWPTALAPAQAPDDGTAPDKGSGICGTPLRSAETFYSIAEAASGDTPSSEASQKATA